MNSDAPWIKEAKKRNEGKNMNKFSTSGTMESFMKQHAADSSGAKAITAPPAVPERPEDVLKKEANACFVKKEYERADALYTEALLVADITSKAVLLTNRSATRTHLERIEEALSDAVSALEIDPTWMKAYHRKAAALTSLSRHRDAYLAWKEALTHCAKDAALIKQFKIATVAWIKLF
eukprot:gene29830-36948_t